MTEEPTLAARLAALEAQLAELQREVVTRRLSIVDDAGVERVLLTAERGTGSVLVRLDRPAGLTTGVEILASEPDHDGPILGMVELRDGDVVERIER